MTRQLQSNGAGAICSNVSISRLFAFFVALSLLFGPLAMDRAMAAMPSSDHSQMVKDGHCEPSDNGQSDKRVAKSCCAATCATAMVVLPQTKTGEPLFDRLATRAAPASFHCGVLSELSTPPPRLS